MRYRLAASAEMLFTELSFVERVVRLHERGFEVEMWNWTTKNMRELASTGATFSSMTGYLHGDLTTADGSAALLETAEESLRMADIIDCPRLNIHGTGLDSQGLPVRPRTDVSEGDWLAAVDTLGHLARLGERAGRTFTLENLNTEVDHPGTPFARAGDTLALVMAVDSPALRVNLDLYHAQIGEGNLIELVRRALPWIGEVQVADVPGRYEPGTGEIRYEAIAAELRRLGYDGVIGLESWARAGSEEALDAFRAAFRA